MAEYATKTRKIRQKDWDNVQKFIKNELDNRKKAEFRREHESIWREVDRQLKMQPMVRITDSGLPVPQTWNSAFELGELSKVSEIITADVMRIAFPMERDWFQAHVETPIQIDPESGQSQWDEEAQKKVDGLLKSMMAQQHIDFGFRSRFELSVKEALHHGSFVAEILWEQDMEVRDGDKVKRIAAPVWVPHSMWNCYPDMSPRIIGTSMFYRGSMIIVSYMPLYKLKQQQGEGWMPSQYSKVPKTSSKTQAQDTGRKKEESEIKDVELATYYGDIVIERGDGDIYLPNSKAVLANGVIVYYKPNELPYPSVIFGGYEKQDVRDPYFTAPIIKLSPMQKLASIMANKFVDNVALKVEPPIVYDGNDPYMVQRDGPLIAPGAKTPSKSLEAFKPIEVGDPTWALSALEMFFRQLQSGTGVSEVRSSTTPSDRQTAFEVNKIAQAGEVRTVDFVDKLNRNLLTWLYMQHELNVMYLDEYAFYNDDINSPDFIRIGKTEMKQAAASHFDVVGARGLLGEEQRNERMGAVTAFASQNPLFAPLLKPSELLVEAYRDAGVKNPERFVNTEQQDMVPAQQVEMAVQEAVAPMQEELAKTQEALTKAQMAEQAKVIDAQTKQAMEMKKLEFEEQKIILEHERKMHEIQLAHQAKLIEIGAQKEVQEQAAKAKGANGEKAVNVVAHNGEKLAEVMMNNSTDLKDSLKEMTEKMVESLKKMPAPVVNIKSGRKRIKAPSGREYVVEDE